MERKINNIFRFYTERRLVEATGIRAHTVRELYVHLKKVGGATIFYHTHAAFLEHHFVKRRFYNDFATWLSSAVQEHKLAEQVAGIDMMEYTSIRQLREAILDVLAKHLAERKGERSRKAPAGEEFHFCRAKSFIFPTGLEARSIPEFFDCIRQISPLSLYFHVFESRLRLQRATSDFAVWLSDMGADDIAGKINRLDPYSFTLEELRDKIIAFKE
jgi:hypothetical protein